MTCATIIQHTHPSISKNLTRISRPLRYSVRLSNVVIKIVKKFVTTQRIHLLSHYSVIFVLE